MSSVAVFIQGFAILAGGMPAHELQELKPETIVVCRPVCEIQRGQEKIYIRTSGFGRFDAMTILSQEYEKARGTGSMAPPSGMAGESGTATPLPGGPSSPSSPEAEVAASPTSSAPAEDGPIKVEAMPDFSKEKFAFYKIPYPDEGTVFLNKNGGKIFVVPAKSCESNCRLTLKHGERVLVEKDFKTGEIPVVSIFAAAGGEGKISWEYLVGETKKVGSFDIVNQTPDSLKKAISEGKPVEIMN